MRGEGGSGADQAAKQQLATSLIARIRVVIDEKEEGECERRGRCSANDIEFPNGRHRPYADDDGGEGSPGPHNARRSRTKALGRG